MTPKLFLISKYIYSILYIVHIEFALISTSTTVPGVCGQWRVMTSAPLEIHLDVEPGQHPNTLQINIGHRSSVKKNLWDNIK